MCVYAGYVASRTLQGALWIETLWPLCTGRDAFGAPYLRVTPCNRALASRPPLLLSLSLSPSPSPLGRTSLLLRTGATVYARYAKFSTKNLLFFLGSPGKKKRHVLERRKEEWIRGRSLPKEKAPGLRYRCSSAYQKPDINLPRRSGSGKEN